MKKLLELYITFMKIGALTFGGGYAMLPVIQREVVENKHWVTDEEVMEYYAIGQCTPGIIAVNTSTFVGNRVAGIPGGLVSTLGFISPAFLIICIIAGLISNFSDLLIVRNAFAGIRICACVLIFNAVIKMWKSSIRDFFTFTIFAAVFLLTILFSLSPILLVLVSGGCGLIGGIIMERRNERSLSEQEDGSTALSALTEDRKKEEE